MADPIVIRTLKVVDKKNNNQEYKLTIEGLAPAASTSNPYLTQSDGDTRYLTQDNASTDYLTKAEARTTYQPISGTTSSGSTTTSGNYATVGHTHSFAQITDKPGSYTPSTHTHDITEIYVNGQSLTTSPYIASSKITDSIGTDATSSSIPTEGAIINYINSLTLPDDASY